MKNCIQILLICLCLLSCKPTKSQNNGTAMRQLQKFEPKDGNVLLFVGQELESVGGLVNYNDGYLNHFKRPAGWTAYTNISPGKESFGLVQKGLDGIYSTDNWGDSDSNMSMQISNKNFENMALAIGLSFVDHEEKVANGTHDTYINKLADFLISLGKRPVFLRIAYEYDGSDWNHYDKNQTIAAYRRIVDILRKRGVSNTAYVWQSTGFMFNLQQYEEWYPGDDYVDWLGLSFFNYYNKIQTIEFARKKGKPIFIAEATPTITDPEAKPNSGYTLETILSNEKQAEQAWKDWFLPLFAIIEGNKDVVKAVSYINCNWKSHPMWFENPTFKGIDARLQTNKNIQKRWNQKISKSNYIHASPSLYDDLYNNK